MEACCVKVECRLCISVRLLLSTIIVNCLGSVVRKIDSAIHRIVIFYPVLKMLLNAVKLNIL